MNPSAFRFVLLVAAGAGALTAFGQAAGAAGDWEFSGRYAHAARSDLDGAGAGAGIAVESYSAALRSSTAVGERTRVLYGLEWTRHDLSRRGETWLPGQLTALSVPLAVSQRASDRWSLLLSLSPRLAGADESLSAARFDLPVLALASYTAAPDLTWSFGLRYGPRSDIAVLPIAGVVWRFAPEWTFRVGWPESGVSWRATEQLTVRAVATVHGGDYRLADDPRAVAGRVGPSLADTWLEYREIRVGLAVEYALNPRLSVRADLGGVVNQRFEYADRDVTLDGGTPLYFGAAVTGRF